MKQLIKNAVYTAQGLAFNKIMPANYFREFGDSIDHSERIPYGAEIQEDGKVQFTICAPKAEKVVVLRNNDIFDLIKEGVLWTGVFELGYGFQTLNILIDGNEILYPLIPIGYGFSRPVNYVDVPNPAEDFYCIKDVPHGSVCSEFYYSKTTERYESCKVYVPPFYFCDERTCYPILYLQHGHGENESCWVNQGKVNFIFDNLIAEGKAIPAIIVMNNGMIQKEEDGERYVDSRAIESLLLEDVIPFIEGKFRVKSEREYRAMAGLSMGSMQTSVVTFKNQDIFAYAGLFSGFMRDIMNSDSSHLDDQYVKTYNKNMKLFFRAMGTEDHFWGEFLEDDEICNEKGLICIRKSYQGDHEWQVWRKCIKDFLELVFK